MNLFRFESVLDWLIFGNDRHCELQQTLPSLRSVDHSSRIKDSVIYMNLET